MIKSKIVDDKEFNRLREEYDKLQEKHAEKQDVVMQLSGENINLKAKIRWKNKLLTEKSEIVKKHEVQLKEATQKFISLEMELSNSKCSVKDLKSVKKGLARKVNMLKKNLTKVKLGDVTKFEEIDNLTMQVKNFNEENKDLRQLVNLLNNEELVTFENGRFNDDIRQAVMKLVDLNVSIK